ncbi:MAG: DUF4249 family protein [Bacteroidota bacterium]
MSCFQSKFNINQLGFFLIIAALATSISCKKEDDHDLLNKAVLEGYIFANEPVDDIHLTKLLPFGGEDTIPQPINDADIKIIWKGVSYHLIPSGGDSGYYHYPGSDLQILEGENYRIEFEYFYRLTSGETVVPPPPTGVCLNTDTMEFEKISLFNIHMYFSNDSVTVSWDNDNEEYYYVVINNLEQDPVPLYPDSLNSVMQGLVSTFLFTRPTQEDYYEILEYYITHFGKHQVKVYKINQEYVDLYTSLDQDSRTLNEPITNLDNGLGVFAAFNCDTANFYVVEK